jgi:D-alanine transaminase
MTSTTEWDWINGEIMPLAEARVGVEDRGFQFADGVYEVVRLYHGRPFLLDRHLARLEQSCAGIQMPPPAREALADAVDKLIARSQVRDGMAYLQVTRGCCPRSHIFPAKTAATVVAYVRALPPAPIPGEGEGVKLLAVADERWKRCWVKSVALLANVLARNQAAAAGADEAVFVEGGSGIVTECSSSNLFAVIGSKLVTHPVGSKVLPGITRAVLLEAAGELDIAVDERPLREEEAVRANELFVTSTTREVGWVARWNERYIGQGRCGPVTLRLHRALQQRVRRETIEGGA